jgi:hypothetical protein
MKLQLKMRIQNPGLPFTICPFQQLRLYKEEKEMVAA